MRRGTRVGSCDLGALFVAGVALMVLVVAGASCGAERPGDQAQLTHLHTVMSDLDPAAAAGGTVAGERTDRSNSLGKRTVMLTQWVLVDATDACGVNTRVLRALDDQLDHPTDYGCNQSPAGSTGSVVTGGRTAKVSVSVYDPGEKPGDAGNLKPPGADRLYVAFELSTGA